MRQIDTKSNLMAAMRAVDCIRKTFLVSIMCLIALGAPVVTNALQIASATDRVGANESPLKRGLAFYRGKTLTVIASGNAGSIIDQQSRVVAQYMAAYLHATINVEDNSSGATVGGQDAIAAAPADGLTYGEISLGGDIGRILLKEPGLNFDPGRLKYIGGNGQSASVLIASPTSPYKTWRIAVRANPPAKMLMLTSGVANDNFAAIVGSLGVISHFNFIHAYANLGSLTQGFVRGDGPLMYASLSTAGPLIQQGKAVPLMTTTVPGVGTQYRSAISDVPTLSTLLKSYPQKSAKQRNTIAAMQALQNITSPFAVQTKVPDYKVDALGAAFQWATQQKGFSSTLLSEGLSPGYTSPGTMKSEWLTLKKYGKLLLPYWQLVGG